MAAWSVQRLVDAVSRRIAHQFGVRAARKTSRDAIDRMCSASLLVLCYGNIYRSPLVAHLLRHDPRCAGIAVNSAGFYSKAGRPCPAGYLKLLGRRGYDLSGHRSTPVDRNHVAAASLIVIMDRYNWDLLRRLDAKAAAKAVWLGALADSGPIEIDDPYGRPDIEVERIVEQLERGARKLAAAIDRRTALGPEL